MKLTDEQCEPKTPWKDITPEELMAMLTAKFIAAFDNPDVQEKIGAAVMPALEPLGEEFEKLEKRIERLEAALFRRAGL